MVPDRCPVQQHQQRSRSVGCALVAGMLFPPALLEHTGVSRQQQAMWKYVQDKTRMSFPINPPSFIWRISERELAQHRQQAEYLCKHPSADLDISQSHANQIPSRSPPRTPTTVHLPVLRSCRARPTLEEGGEVFLEMGLDGPALKRFPPSAYVCDPGKSRPSAGPFLFFLLRRRKKLFQRGGFLLACTIDRSMSPLGGIFGFRQSCML